MADNIRSASLLLALLNPFLVIIYLLALVEKLDARQFRLVLLKAGMIASVVFCGFAVLGDAIFSTIIQAEFASFQIFGGVVFLLIALQFVFQGPNAVEFLRGETDSLASAVAMPVLIGPGTIGASVVIGKRHDIVIACVIVLVGVFTSVVIMMALKSVHDYVRPRNEPLIQRYIEIMGRIMALYVGTISIQMLMQGLETWIEKF